MSDIYSYGKYIGCEPPLLEGVKLVNKNGFAVIQQKQELLGLKVVFGMEINSSLGPCIDPGETVYIRGELIKAECCAKTYTVDGVDVVLIPVDQVLFFTTV